MGTMVHILDALPKGILLPQAEVPWNPGPSDSKPVPLPLKLAASPADPAFYFHVTQQYPGLVELPVQLL